ncbi:MAG TPA: hypothetical protein DCX27_10705 [Balneola sp.]|nr:hypothetical protein [Balneola sp.]
MKINTLYTTDEHDAGSEVEITDFSGEPTGLFIKVCGVDSKKFRDRAKIQQKAYVEAFRAEKDFDDDEIQLETLVECTLGWKGTDEKFSKKLCKELYLKAPYVRDQIDRFMGDRSNFTKAKPKK